MRRIWFGPVMQHTPKWTVLLGPDHLTVLGLTQDPPMARVIPMGAHLEVKAVHRSGLQARAVTWGGISMQTVTASTGTRTTVMTLSSLKSKICSRITLT